MPQDIFQAIADPTRRQIIDLLAHKTLNINDVVDKFDISRPAISKHIKILNNCGLLVIKKDGRNRYCRADTNKLLEVVEWAQRYSVFWNERLDALETALNKNESGT